MNCTAGIRTVLYTLCLVFVAAASAVASTDRPVTMTQVSQNTRSFDTDDMKKVMRAVVSSYQADNFIIKNSNSDLGVITAAKDVDVESAGEALVSIVLFGVFASWDKTMQVESTASVAPLGNQTKVQVNFLGKTTDSDGDTSKVSPISDDKMYQDFFMKLHNALN